MKQSSIDLIWPEQNYCIPKAPNNETDIMFHEFKKKDQYWRRPAIPGKARWDMMTPRDQYLFVERERQRRAEGVHMFINGELQYITGTHYDHLVYAKFDYRPRFLQSQVHDFYFRDLLQHDKQTYGGLVIKPRRYGYTDMEVTDHTCVAISGFNKYTGMMSDTREKVYETIYDKITASYIQRPKYVRPDILMRSGVIPRTKLVFKTGKVGKAGSENDISYNNGVSLGSMITPKSTTVMGFDGRKLHKLTLDEIWKWTKVSPQRCWEKQKKTLFDGGSIIGKAMLLSTMGDDEDYEKAILEGIQMWHDSDPGDRDENGFTKTGLYRYFVPGYYALFSDETGFRDIYGNINIDQATNYILNERKKYEEGSMDWTFEVRRYPLTIEEALGSAIIQGVFDKKRIQERITIINKLPESEKPYFEGLLIEDNLGKVHVEQKLGEPWLFSKLPYISKEKNVDRSNRWRKLQDKIFAPKNPEGCLGYDPVRYVETDTTSDSVSKACITGRYKYDYFRGVEDSVMGKRSCLFLDRLENPEEIHYEVFKAAKLLGFKIMYERQIESFLRLMRELQATDFLLTGPDGKFGMWTDSRKTVLTNGVNAIRQRLAKPKELWLPDRLMEEPFLPGLQQYHDFNPKKTTKFDFVMADIMLDAGLAKLVEMPFESEEEYDNQWNDMMNVLFPTRS